MSLMVAEVYEALIEAGTSEQKAKAAAGAIPIAGELATKEDLRELRDELRDEMGERFGKLERDMAVLKFAYGPVILALLVKIAFFHLSEKRPALLWRRLVVAS